MLEITEKNKKYIVGNIVLMVTFGLMGLVLAPVVKYIIKASKRHSKVFRWVTVAICAVIGIYYMYAILCKQEYNISLMFLCIVIVINGVLYNCNR